MTSTDRLLQWTLMCLGRRVPYIWGGRDPDVGLDCSGLVTCGLWYVGGPDWRRTHNTDRLWAECPRVAVEDIRPGDVVLYWGASTGAYDVSHAMLYVGYGTVVGQAYGGRNNTSAQVSVARGHWTKALPLRYRSDIAGAVRLPLPRL